jgi:hypothetical protein
VCQRTTCLLLRQVTILKSQLPIKLAMLMDDTADFGEFDVTYYIYIAHYITAMVIAGMVTMNGAAAHKVTRFTSAYTNIN